MRSYNNNVVAYFLVLYSILCCYADVVALPGRIGIVEDHHHVLWHVLDAVEAGTLPKKGVTLIHFDSHADMSLVETHWFEAAQMFSKPFEMVQRTDINNWVTAAWGLGIVERMVFIEPPWGTECRHLPYSDLIFTIGKIGNEFKLHVRTPQGEDVSQHYHPLVSDIDLPNYQKFAKPSQMSDRREVFVKIVRLEEDFVSQILDFTRESSNDIMLSVDMDVFATESPSHLWFLREADIPLRYQHWLANKFLNRSYDKAWWMQQLNDDLTKHCPSLPLPDEEDDDSLLTFNMSSLPPLRSRGTANVLLEEWLTGENRRNDHSAVRRVWQLFDQQLDAAIAAHGESVVREQFESLIRYPVHIGTRSTIQYLQTVMECLFSRMAIEGHIPKLITLARSPAYLPLHLLRDIECRTLHMLGTHFPDIKDLFFEAGIRKLNSSCHARFIPHRVASFLPAAEFADPVPVDLVIHNRSPESLHVYWNELTNDEANGMSEWMFREELKAGQVADAVTRHKHHWQLRTIDDVVVMDYEVDQDKGHTASIIISTGQVDAALASKGVFRHHDI